MRLAASFVLFSLLQLPASPDSPFGFHPAVVTRPGYPANGFVGAEYLSVGRHRPSAYAFWFVVQPDLNDPAYDWTIPDGQYGLVPQGVHILANIAPENPRFPQGYTQPGTYIPIDIPKYLDFVMATVDRYNGDGDATDMPGLSNPVKYWQVGNEPNANNPQSGFEDLQCITYQAIKSVCPECVVLNGGVAGLGMIGGQDYVTNFETAYEPILQGLAGQCVDVFDFHWYGNATGDYRFGNPSGAQDILAYISAGLAANGFPSGMPIWITEMGTYSGDPPPVPYDPTADLPPQTERQQAGDYFKRFIYSLSRGVKKVFPAFGLMEGFVAGDRNYFDHTGLIYNGIGPEDPDYPDADPDDLGLGVKKLGYYTYKKMTEKLEGADWSTITLLRDGTDTDHLYLVRVTRDGEPVHIAWWDYFVEPGYTPGDTKDITLTGLSGGTATATTVVPYAELGRDVTDSETAFVVTAYPITGGQATVTLADDPVIVETTYADRIVFTSDRDGNQEIYVMNPDGTGQTRLTNNPATAQDPLGVDADPAWSPGRTRIAFMSTRTGDGEIWVMNADGSYPVDLTNDPTRWDLEPEWAPDGRRIAYVSSQIDANGAVVEGTAEIFTIDPDGTNRRQRTYNTYTDAYPVFSPDGTEIVFHHDGDGDHDVFVMDTNGNILRQLTFNDASDRGCSWSPDGKQLVFTSDRSGDGNIYVMNADGSNVFQCTDSPGPDTNPSFSPDGTRIVFQSVRAGVGGGPDLFVMNSDGSNVTRITNNTYVDKDPDWMVSLPMPGDLDHDGDVDLADFVTFAGCFGLVAPDPPTCPAEAFFGSDLDGNGAVNLADFVIFAEAFTG